MASFGLQYEPLWESKFSPSIQSIVKTAIDGTPTIFFLDAKYKDGFRGIHTFKFEWARHNDIISLRSKAMARKPFTISLKDGTNLKVIFLDSNSIKAEPVINEFASHDQIKGKPFDLYNGTIEVFVL